MTGESRGYSWETFAPGNQVAMTHGAYSTRAVAPRAQAILAEVTAATPAWLNAVDASALTAWAEAEARCDVLRTWTNDHGLIDEVGKPTNAADLLIRMERLAANMRSRLGFDPLSRAAVARDSAIARSAASAAVQQASATGRAFVEAQERREGSDGSA